MSTAEPAKVIAALRWFVLFVVRGLLLWLVIPIGPLAWMLGVAIWHVSLPRFLAWLDVNLIALLTRVLRMRREWRERFDWVPARQMNTVTHRLGVNDLF